MPSLHRHPLTRLVAASLTALGLAASFSVGACSLVIDGEIDSCTTPEDCVNLAGTTCEAGRCVSVDKCQSNADCSDETQICRRVSPRTCVPVLGAGCQEIYPEDVAVWRDDSTILVGVTSPMTEEGAPSDTGVSISNASKLAVKEINAAGGVTGGETSRRLALVICDDQGSTEVALQNGDHLVAAGIQSTIGPAYSGMTKAFSEQKAIPAGMLTISTSATSPDLTGVSDTDPTCVSACAGSSSCVAACPPLLWRTSPSDLLQGDAIVKYFPELELFAKGRVDPPVVTLKVQILHKSDAYGEGLRDAIVNNLEFNGQKATQQTANFKTAGYGNPDDGDPIDQAAVQATIDFLPDVVILIGTNEVGPILTTIEAGYDTAGQAPLKPYYVFADGGLVSAVANAARDAGARTRVRGTIPGSASAVFEKFRFEYDQEFPTGSDDASVFGSAGAYDSVYMLAYAARTTTTPRPSGADLARGLAKMVGGATRIEPGRTQFGTGMQTIGSGAAIDFDGASGPLDFDLETGEAPSDIQIWCLPSGPDVGGNAPQGSFSGRYYEAASQTMKGSAASFCTE